jgi:carbamoyl-phosphate synthase large subunit
MKKVKVLVTGAGGIGHGSSILKALEYSSLDMDLYVADMSPRLLQTSTVQNKSIIPAANSKDYIPTLIQLVKTHNIDCIFTGSEPELEVVSLHRNEFEKIGCSAFLNNHQVIEDCKNKYVCFKKLDQLGFDIPETILIDSKDDIDSVTQYPVVVKPYKNSGASKNVYIVENIDELKVIATYLLSRNIPIIAQQYIPYCDNEFTVGVTSELDQTTVINSIALHKFIEGCTSLIRYGDRVLSSGITQGEFKEYKEIRTICEKIAQAIGSTGPLNIQLRTYKDKILPFEINPRFSGTTSARAYNNYNEPEYFIRKCILNDPNAKESICSQGQGYMVKGLDEKYFKN